MCDIRGASTPLVQRSLYAFGQVSSRLVRDRNRKHHMSITTKASSTARSRPNSSGAPLRCRVSSLVMGLRPGRRACSPLVLETTTRRSHPTRHRGDSAARGSHEAAVELTLSLIAPQWLLPMLHFARLESSAILRLTMNVCPCQLVSAK